jgi:hypothetical protein
MNATIIDGLSTSELATLVELQRVELDRLLGEQRRLNDRIDKMLNMQEREQVLRQQMQLSLVERIAKHQALRTSSSQSILEQPQVLDRLHRTEQKFSALQMAVSQLIDFIERKERALDADEAKSYGLAPGSPIV